MITTLLMKSAVESIDSMQKGKSFDDIKNNFDDEFTEKVKNTITELSNYSGISENHLYDGTMTEEHWVMLEYGARKILTEIKK